MLTKVRRLCEIFYVSLMVVTKQKPIVDTHKMKRKERKYTITENHHIRKKESKKGRKETRSYKLNSYKTTDKIAKVNPHLSRIPLM